MANRSMQFGSTEVRIFSDQDELTASAADQLIRLLAPKPGTPQPLHLALAGGATPIALYQQLARVTTAPLWTDVHLWFGDERCVPWDHPDSNFGSADIHLLRPLGLQRDHVHPIPTNLSPDAAAQAYELELARTLPRGSDGVPVFDLILLGLGTDGHTASLFPGTLALHECTRSVVANWVPQLASQRITLTFPVLACARRIWVCAVGSTKADIVGQVLKTPPVPDRWPITALTEHEGELIWWLDAAAAREL